MTDSSKSRFRSIARLGLAGRCALLTLLTGAALAIVSPVAGRLHGTDGVLAAVIAAAVCLAGSLASLALGHRFQGPDAALRRLLASMLLRMVVPLSFCLVIATGRGPLAEAGCVYYILIFYLVTLAVDTVLSLPQEAADQSAV